MRPAPRTRRGLVMLRQFETENEVSAKSSSSAESSELETSNQKNKRKPLGLLSVVSNMGNSPTKKLPQSQPDSEVDDEPRKELLFSPPHSVKGKTNKQSTVKGKVESSGSSCQSSPPQKLRMRGNKQVFTKKPAAAPSGVESSASSQQSPMVSPLLSPRPPSSQSSVASSLPSKPRGRPKKATAVVDSSASSILSSPQSGGSKKPDAVQSQTKRSSRRNDSVKTTATGGATESSASSCYSPVIKKKSLKQQKLEAIQDSPGQRKSVRLASERTKEKEEVVAKKTPVPPARKRSATTTKAAAAAEKHAKKYKPLSFKETDDFPPLNVSSRRESASSSRLDESDQPKKVPVYRLEPKPEHVVSTVDDIYEMDFDSSEAKPIKKRQKRTRKVAPVKKKVQPPVIVDDKEEKRTLRKRSLPAVVEEESADSDDDQLVEEEPQPKKAKPGRPPKQQLPKEKKVLSEEEPTAVKDPVSKSGRPSRQQPPKKAQGLSDEDAKSKANSTLTNSNNVVLQTTPLLKKVAQRLREEVQLNPELAETVEPSLEEELVPPAPQEEEEFLPPPPPEEESLPLPQVEEEPFSPPQEQERMSTIAEEPHHLSYGTDGPEEGENPAEESAELILAGAGQEGVSMMFPPSINTAPELDNFGFDEVAAPAVNSRKAPVVVESTPLKRTANRVPMAAADFISPVAKPTRSKPVEKLPVVTEAEVAVPSTSANVPHAPPPASKKRTSCSRPARLDGKAALRLAALAQPAQKREPRARKGKKMAPAPALPESDVEEEEDHHYERQAPKAKVVVAIDPETHFTEPPKVSYSRKNRGKVFSRILPKKPLVATVYESDEEEAEEGSEEEYQERAPSRSKKTNKGKKEAKTTPKKKKVADEYEEECRKLQAEYEKVDNFDLSTLSNSD